MSEQKQLQNCVWRRLGKPLSIALATCFCLAILGSAIAGSAVFEPISKGNQKGGGGQGNQTRQICETHSYAEDRISADQYLGYVQDIASTPGTAGIKIPDNAYLRSVVAFGTRTAGSYIAAPTCEIEEVNPTTATTNQVATVSLPLSTNTHGENRQDYNSTAVPLNSSKFLVVYWNNNNAARARVACSLVMCREI